MNEVKATVELSHEQEWHAQNTARMAVLQDGIAKKEAFAKLKEIPEFKELILDLYIKDEAANLVELLADPSTNNADSQRSIQTRLGGISALQCFMRQYDQAGRTAEAELAQLSAINARIDLGKSVSEILDELNLQAG